MPEPSFLSTCILDVSVLNLRMDLFALSSLQNITRLPLLLSAREAAAADDGLTLCLKSQAVSENLRENLNGSKPRVARM